jgi:fluoride ion exporter CrcB/FEX
LIAAITFKSTKFSNQQKLLWITGFAGGLTTFSSLAVLTLEASFINGFAYLFATFLFTFISLYIARKLIKI